MLLYSPDDLKKIASETTQAIDDYSLATLKDKRRTHLGASEVNKPCMRRQWYKFRWVREDAFPPRMLRLFKRGHKEEVLFIEWLIGAGYVIHEHNRATGKQWLFSEHGGHYGGSTDGLATHPVYFPSEYIITEFKTHNDKSFAGIRKNGFKASKPDHFAQMSNYGAKFGCRYGLYLALNKNDDNLHCEVVELDWTLANDLTSKALHIITSRLPPRRITNASPSYYECKGCESLGPCFYKQPPDRNCRSCINAIPIDNAEWHCSHWNSVIPKDFIPKGCDEYKPITV